MSSNPTSHTDENLARRQSDQPPSTAQDRSSRPSLQHRTSSTGSVSHSLSDASSSHRNHYKPQRHVVGGGGITARVGPRNLSVGKNLNKLGASRAGPQLNGDKQLASNHNRVKSGELVEARSSSPRPSHAMKRNSTTHAIPRNTSHTALKKNFSSGHLPRHGSSKNIMKQGLRHHPPVTKRTRSHQSEKSDKSERSESSALAQSPPTPVQPTVRFALGKEEVEGEDEWTEESASPLTTRDHTRQSSVSGAAGVGGPGGKAENNTLSDSKVEASQRYDSGITHLDKSSASPRTVPADLSIPKALSNFNLTRPLDPDAITSRLLQRKVSNAEPRISNVSAIVQADTSGDHSLSRSQASFLVNSTPGKDLVSRFINGDSNAGTPATTGYLADRQQTLSQEGAKSRNTFDDAKRNKSMPSMAKDKAQSASATPAASPQAQARRRAPPADLPPSRTQQKLLLQRASSTIEPQKHIPAVLPRPGAPQLLNAGGGLHYGPGLVSARLGDTADGLVPAQIQALFNGASREYNVIRRFRMPVMDAMKRIGKTATATPAAKQKSQPKQPPSQPSRSQPHSRTPSLRHQEGAKTPQNPPQLDVLRGTAPAAQNPRRAHESGATTPIDRVKAHARARVSFDLPSPTREAHAPDEEDDFAAADPSRPGSLDPSPSAIAAGTGPRVERDRERDEAFEVCRRLWEGLEGAGVLSGGGGAVEVRV